MDENKIKRINELAKKKKAEGLTPSEIQEQQQLRREYLDAIKKNFRQTLESIEYKD